MSQGDAPVVPYTRRERLRIATIREIKDVARELLVQQGPENVTIRAIARDMGMTAPAVYRYFTSRDALIMALRADIFAEMAERVRVMTEALPADDPGRRLIAAARALRAWALRNPHEFGLVLGPWTQGLGRSGARPDPETGWTVFGSLWSHLFEDLWRVRPWPVPEVAELEPALVEQLRGLSEAQEITLPTGAIAVMLRCWVRLYGLMCLETLGFMSFALADGEAFFERELRDLTRVVGIEDLFEQEA
ncbi:TetR/AcrR family transcriptional regulator [Streptomyces sp. LX-29]|uniref:TetR/AcrR family transcriptional regulator n=1 Tax=Streptomyces sp. LX-29 TaxID=2900152 RepID=UPI00240E293E|nr:helix-turn-helix domain-containing protein [Streptomyces sp. LX-29]WFB06674.1 TetR/AcrR family transcriptional regulator [Streptomyces sp. LX-29]